MTTRRRTDDLHKSVDGLSAQVAFDVKDTQVAVGGGNVGQGFV